MSATAIKNLLQTIREQEGTGWQELVKAFIKSKKLSKEEKKALGLEVYHEVLKHAVANLNIAPEEAKELDAVQDYFSLSDKAVKEVKHQYAPKALKMMAEWFLIDGIITPSEMAQLIAFGKEMTMTEKEVRGFVSEMAGKKETMGGKP